MTTLAGRYDGWAHTLRRLRWLVGRAPTTCPLCQEPGHGWHGNLLLTPAILTHWGRCSYCGERLPNADAELFT